jgi:hypothetical protein
MLTLEVNKITDIPTRRLVRSTVEVSGVQDCESETTNGSQLVKVEES